MYTSMSNELVALLLAHSVIFVTVSIFKQIISYMAKIAKFM